MRHTGATHSLHGHSPLILGACKPQAPRLRKPTMAHKGSTPVNPDCDRMFAKHKCHASSAAPAHMVRHLTWEEQLQGKRDCKGSAMAREERCRRARHATHMGRTVTRKELWQEKCDDKGRTVQERQRSDSRVRPGIGRAGAALRWCPCSP